VLKKMQSKIKIAPDTITERVKENYKKVLGGG
jgi:hypothetical protein